MTDTLTFAKARDQMQAFKGAEIRRCGVSLVVRAFQLLDEGVGHFGPDDLPDLLTFEGQGIVGSTVAMLRSAHIIEDWFGSNPDEGLFHGRRRSKRESANGRKVCTYRLLSRAVAETYLRQNDQPVKPQQGELFKEG